MLGFIKALPLIILLAGAGYGAHKFMINEKDKRIDQLQQQVDYINQQNVALQAAAQQNEDTIRGLEEKNKQQVAQISSLQTTSAQWEDRAKEAMKIFANHNFTKLARLKPELIEKRANAATSDVFRSVEDDSKEIDQLDDTKQEDTNVEDSSSSN